MPAVWRRAEGLRFLDWGEAQALLHVPAFGATHLVDAELARWVMSWPEQGMALDEQSPGIDDAGHLRVQVDALVQAGIVQGVAPGSEDA